MAWVKAAEGARVLGLDARQRVTHALDLEPVSDVPRNWVEFLQAG